MLRYRSDDAIAVVSARTEVYAITLCGIIGYVQACQDTSERTTGIVVVTEMRYTAYDAIHYKVAVGMRPGEVQRVAVVSITVNRRMMRGV